MEVAGVVCPNDDVVACAVERVADEVLRGVVEEPVDVASPGRRFDLDAA